LPLDARIPDRLKVQSGRTIAASWSARISVTSAPAKGRSSRSSSGWVMGKEVHLPRRGGRLRV